MNTFAKFREENILLTKQQLRNSVNNDILIVQTITNIEELKIVANSLSTRFRESFAWYNPELEKSLKDNKKLVEVAFKESRKKDSIGGNISENDKKILKEFASKIFELFEHIENQEKYLALLMVNYCPNLQALAGDLIGAKLLLHARSLKRLSDMPASTIQLLGAEKALFKHLTEGSRSPKYGLLFTHQLVQKSKDRGKAAKMLANKISLAVKIDYFKGKFIGDKLKKRLEDKLL